MDNNEQTRDREMLTLNNESRERGERGERGARCTGERERKGLPSNKSAAERERKIAKS